MKIKLIENYIEFGSNEKRFNEEINDFIKDKEVIDIKYQSVAYKSAYSYSPLMHQSALIMYEEGSDD